MYIEMQALEHLMMQVSNQSITQYQEDAESKEYKGASFAVNKHYFLYRKAKITPKKTGYFVALWQRNLKGTTEPFNNSSPYDFYIIEVDTPEGSGYFVFPKETLITQGILSTNDKEGKRGFRLYAPHNIPTNKQAFKTQLWQIAFYVTKENLASWQTILKQL